MDDVVALHRQPCVPGKASVESPGGCVWLLTIALDNEPPADTEIADEPPGQWHLDPHGYASLAKTDTGNRLADGLRSAVCLVSDSASIGGQPRINPLHHLAFDKCFVHARPATRNLQCRIECHYRVQSR